MAQYLYRCPECKLDRDVEHSIKEDPTILCDECGASCVRVPQATGVVLRGKGFYRNDKSFGQTDQSGQTWGEG